MMDADVVDRSRPTWRRTLIRICVLYTAVTLVGSVYALATGQTTDTHVHLLLRLGFVVVGVGAFDLYDLLRLWFPGARDGLLGATAYVTAVAAILSGMWLWGAAGGELHPDAFRDGFLNFTGVGLVVAAVLALRDKVRRPPRPSGDRPVHQRSVPGR
jgi:hypothetical protein